MDYCKKNCFACSIILLVNLFSTSPKRMFKKIRSSLNHENLSRLLDIGICYFLFGQINSKIYVSLLNTIEEPESYNKRRN